MLHPGVRVRTFSAMLLSVLMATQNPEMTNSAAEITVAAEVTAATTKSPDTMLRSLIVLLSMRAQVWVFTAELTSKQRRVLTRRY